MSRIIQPHGKPVLRIIIDMDANGAANMKYENPGGAPGAMVNVDLVGIASILTACTHGIFQQIGEIQKRQKGIITNAPEEKNSEPQAN